MGQLTSQRMKDALRGLLDGLDASDISVGLDAFVRRRVDVPVTDGGTAATPQTETPLWYNDTGLSYRVVTFGFMPAIAVTASDTNYAGLNWFRRDSAGINQVTMAAPTTQTTGQTVGSGNLTAFLTYVVPAAAITGANLIVAPGQHITCSVTKVGTGVAIGAATAQCKMFVILEPTN